nr:MAG: hypothetical protein [Microvirus sp.]
MWKDFFKNTVLKPGLQRLGTVAAVWLLTAGDWLCKTFDACGLVTKGGAETVVAYVIAVALLCFDLAVIHLDRMRSK